MSGRVRGYSSLTLIRCACSSENVNIIPMKPVDTESLHHLKARLLMANYFFDRYPKTSIFVVLGLIITGALETLGIIAILPLLDQIFLAENATNSIVSEAFNSLGIASSPVVFASIIALIFILKAVILLLIMRRVGQVSARMAYEQRDDLFNALIDAKWSFYVDKSVGLFVNSALNEASKGGACFMALSRILESIFTASILLLGAMLTSLEVSVVALLVGLGLIKLLGGLVRLSGRTGFETSEANKSLSKGLTDALQNMKSLKVMSLENKLFAVIREQSGRLYEAYSKQLIAKYALTALREPFAVTLLLAGVVFFSKQGVTFSQILILAALFYRIVNSLGSLQQNLQTLAINESYFWSFRSTINDALCHKERLSGRAQPDFSNSIVFEQVTFCYESKLILNEVSLILKNKELIAIVGLSGSGKTTLLDLVSGINKPSRGRILIDDRDLSTLDLRTWRQMIGYVAQECFIFNDSIRNNITLGDSRVSDDEIWDVLRDVGADNFVLSQPNALDQSIGEQGALLSGGQRQRISLARALIRRPVVLIVDELTASLDPETEEKICRMLKSLSRSTMVLAISHHGLMTNFADEIYEVTQASATSNVSNVRRLTAS